MHDLAEHTSSLLSIVGALTSVVGVMIWKKLNSIESKVDHAQENHQRCREEVLKTFATKDELREHRHDFKDWQNGRREIWEAINGHTHDDNGKVVR